MRKSILVAVTVLAALAAPAFVAAGEQTVCPVSGEAIDKASSPHVDWQGQRIYFCCDKCPVKFKADPEKYFAKFAEAGVELENIQTVCPVSGETLGEGDMGAPVAQAYKGRTVMFCCKMCVGKFDKDPDTYLAKLPGEQPGPAK